MGVWPLDVRVQIPLEGVRRFQFLSHKLLLNFLGVTILIQEDVEARSDRTDRQTERRALKIVNEQGRL